MATFKLLLQSTSETANIYIRLSMGRNKVFKRKTGFIINSNDWSKVKGSPKSKTPESKNLKSELDKFKIKIEDAFNKANLKGIIINGDWLQEQINLIHNRKPIVKLDILTNYTQYYIDTANTRKNQRGGLGLSPNRIKSIKTFKSKIEEYQKEIKKTLQIKDISPQAANKFKDWLFEQGFSINYVGKNITNLKTVCRDARKNNIETHNNIDLIETVSETKKSEEVITLSFDELEQIKNADIKRLSLINARKWLILGCYLGQRASDLLNITEKNIIEIDGNNFIELEQQKTGKRIVVPVLPEAKEIINTGLPYKISLPKLNEYIKDVCEIAKINQPTKGKIRDKETNLNKEGIYPKYKLIGSHICRRSFATNYYSDIPTPVLIGITGHSTERMFLKYIGKTAFDNAKQMIEYVNKMQPRKKDSTFEVIKHAN